MLFDRLDAIKSGMPVQPLLVTKKRALGSIGNEINQGA